MYRRFKNKIYANQSIFTDDVQLDMFSLSEKYQQMKIEDFLKEE